MTARPAAPPTQRTSRRTRQISAGLVAAALAVLVPALALAHPLGNFTINHFAALRIAPDAISLDVVIDRAEIPAFQESQRIDLDANGTVTSQELDQARQGACGALTGELRLTVDGRVLALTTVAAGLTTPPGAGGLSTMRLVCEYEARPEQPITAAATVAFEDTSFSERIGWREIVVLGNGATLSSSPPRQNGDGLGASARLTAYPTDLLAQPLDMRSITVTVSPGGPVLEPWTAPDATALAAGPMSPSTSGGGAIAPAGAVPGGIAEDLAALVDVTDLTPLAILLSLSIAFALGVVHALSPGHGKTIMAAYLVGAKGSSRQAVGLGLAVTVSHTLGVLALAGITLAASSILPPERLYPILGVASGGLVVLIGTSLLWSRLRALGLGKGREQQGQAHAHPDGHVHHHGHEHPDGVPHLHARAESTVTGHPHPHSHAPFDTEISWRGLLALGLSGGLVPSASALILLLGSIAAGRVAYGLVLVLGFGLGMAVVLAGIGLLIVHARRLIERRPSIAGLQRIVAPVQLVTASLVVVLGIVLTSQALTQVL
jgi:nickel/cobalt transporter (NicO) family protein